MKILNSVGSVFDRFINNVRDNNNKKSEAKIADVQPNIKPAKYPSQFVPLIKEDRITDTFVRLAKMDSGSNEVIITDASSFEEGIDKVQQKIKGSCSFVIL